LGDIKGAIQDYDKAIELNPKYFDAYYERGEIKRITADVKGAIEDFDKAIQIAPDHAETYYKRGIGW